MTPQYSLDVAGRLQAFLDAFGPVGVAVLTLMVAACVIYQLLRGSGLSLLLLLVSYSFVFVDVNAVNTGAFFVRTLSLGLLVLGACRSLVIPGWAFYGMVGYVLLGVIFSARAPDISWALQSAGLLAVTIVALTAGLGQYLASYAKVETLFRLFVIAGVVWTLASIPALLDFIAGRTLRFAGGTGVLATNYAGSGVMFLPFMLWATVQRGHVFWRVVGIGGLLIIPLCLFLSGTRTALVASTLACAPLVLRGGVSRTARAWILLAVLAVSAVFLARHLLQGRGLGFLTDRLTSTSLSGREALWSKAFGVCKESPLVGRGIGSQSALAKEAGFGNFHNAYLSIWCNTGILGLMLVMSVLFGYLWRAFALMRRVRHPVAMDAARVSLGFLVALCALGIVESSFASPSNSSIAILLIGATLVNRVGKLTEQDEADHAAWLAVVRSSQTGSSPSPAPDRSAPQPG